MIGGVWDEGPDAGRWIADRLAQFGPTVGHAVPIGYQAYAVAPISVIEDYPTRNRWSFHTATTTCGPVRWRRWWRSVASR